MHKPIKESFGFTFGTMINQMMKLLETGVPDNKERKKIYECLIESLKNELEKIDD